MASGEYPTQYGTLVCVLAGTLEGLGSQTFPTFTGPGRSQEGRAENRHPLQVYRGTQVETRWRGRRCSCKPGDAGEAYGICRYTEHATTPKSIDVLRTRSGSVGTKQPCQGDFLPFPASLPASTVDVLHMHTHCSLLSSPSTTHLPAMQAADTSSAINAEAGGGPKTLRHKTLSAYYDHILTLEHLLVSVEGLLFHSDPAEYRELLEHTICAPRGDKARVFPPYGPTDGTQQEAIDRILQDFRGSDVLLLGSRVS